MVQKLCEDSGRQRVNKQTDLTETGPVSPVNTTKLADVFNTTISRGTINDLAHTNAATPRKRNMQKYANTAKTETLITEHVMF